MSDSPRAAAAERITRAVVEHHPYVLCFRCLAAEHGTSEFVVREIAQVAVFREGFRVVPRVCYRCNAAGEKRRLESMLTSRGFDMTRTIHVVVLANGEGIALTQ
jgi:hypothetical protein